MFLVLAACGPVAGCGEAEVLEVAEFAELCGVEGPVRVLELAEEQVAHFPPRRVGERLVFEIGRVAGAPGEAPVLPVADQEIWTTGLCGESPTRLEDRYSELFVTEHWPDVVLACDDEGGQIVSLSAAGPIDPHVVFSGVTCAAQWTRYGLVSPDWVDGVLFFPYPEDPRSGTAAPIKLPGEVKFVASLPVFTAVDDGVLVLRPDDELVYVDLRDLSVTSVQAGVGDFVVSPSGRYVLWGGVGFGVGSQPALLLDRETGSTVGLGETTFSRMDTGLLRWAEQGFVLLGSGPAPQIFRLSDFASAVVPAGHTLARIGPLNSVGPLPDGRWIVSAERDSSLHYLDIGTGALTPMFTRPGQVIGREEDGTQVLEVFKCCNFARADDEGAVWFVPDDGSQPTRLAGRSTMFGWRASEGSWVSPVDLDPVRGARLVRVDTATRAERVIDERVFAVLWMGDRGLSEVVRYSVQDGARSGVWQVKLAR